MAPQDKGWYFTDAPHRQRAWHVSTSVPVSSEITVAPSSTAAMIEEVRHVRPSTQLALDPVFRNHADIDFSNLVLGSTIATSSMSTVSTTSV